MRYEGIRFRDGRISELSEGRRSKAMNFLPSAAGAFTTNILPRRLLLPWLLAAFAFSAWPAEDALQGIKQRGVLKWGADAEGGAPYVFPDPQNPERMVGFELTTCKVI